MSFWNGLCPWSAREWSRRRRGRSTTRCLCTRTARIGSGQGSARCGPAAEKFQARRRPPTRKAGSRGPTSGSRCKDFGWSS